MPIKKYHEQTFYKRIEKKMSPVSSASISSEPFRSILPESDFSLLKDRRVPVRHSSVPIDDEYNPYRYGLVPLSERSIYREFEVIQPPQNMAWKIKDYDNTYSTPQRINSTQEIIHWPTKDFLRGSTKSVRYADERGDRNESITNKSTVKKTQAQPKVVRIVTADDRDEREIEKISNNSNVERRKTSSTSTIGKPSSSRERIIPIRRAEYDLEAEPIPTEFTSYKCTKYTLNEVRSC